ncbi:YopX family protein [Staphylococcus nepalensis]|uniref:YopX family protein n=1 Tax=Staphylococcus nepalensis TaxID=214473 RepID=UPI0030167487
MIKFRAWDKFYECMINPAGIELENGEVAHIIEQLPGETTKSSITYYEIMQSTGLKDKNGMEIFEGDILKGLMDFGPAGYVESVAPVSYHKIDGYQLHYFLLEHTEVIGNVYEDKNIKFGPVEE